MSRRGVLRAFVGGLAALIAIGSFAPAARAQTSSTADVFARLKPSLGLVFTRDKKEVAFGTAFCIASSPTTSYYLTNAHVVGSHTTVTVFRQFPTYAKLHGTVIAVGARRNPDLAVIRVPMGNIPVVALRTSGLREGDPVGIAGYPYTQLEIAAATGQFLPSVHLGTISSLQVGGALVEFDAQVFPGNSGGPIFDPSTGVVLGVVRAKLHLGMDVNLGIGIGTVVVPFLQHRNIAFTRADDAAGPTVAAAGNDTGTPPPSGAMRDLPGADTIAVAYDSTKYDATVSEVVREIATDFGTKLAAATGARTIVVDAPVHDAASASKVAHDHGTLFVASYDASYRFLGAGANPFGGLAATKWKFGLQSTLYDEFGQNWLNSGTIEKNVSSTRGAAATAQSSFADLDDRAVAAMRTQLDDLSGNDPGARTNFFRYAFPLADGAKRAFIGLEPADRGATAFVLPFSPAVKAGLQNGARVLSVNGTPTQGKSKSELSSLLTTPANGGTYDFVIEAGDGRPQHVKFAAEDVRWYLDHREPVVRDSR